MDETTTAAGARCRRCNGNRACGVLDKITGLCEECVRSVMLGPLVQDVLASIDRKLAEEPGSHEFRMVAVDPPAATSAGFVAGGSFEIADVKHERAERFAAAMREQIETVPPEVAESIAELETRLRRDFNLPMPPVALSELLRRQADVVRGFESIKFSDPTEPPPRPDGFSQSAVDAAKATLLAPVKPKAGKR